jgi:hypothetical protein
VKKQEKQHTQDKKRIKCLKILAIAIKVGYNNNAY